MMPLWKMNLSSFKTNEVDNYGKSFQMANTICYDRKDVFCVDPCTTSTVYGKLSRKFLILYLLVLYLALFHLLYKCSCKIISPGNTQGNLNLSVFPRSLSPQVVSRDTTIAFQEKIILLHLEGSQFSRVPLIISTIRYRHHVCFPSYFHTRLFYRLSITHWNLNEGNKTAYFTNISTLLSADQSMSNNFYPLKEDSSLESYFKWRLIWFRLLVRREKVQAHSFPLYDSKASINLKFLHWGAS